MFCMCKRLGEKRPLFENWNTIPIDLPYYLLPDESKACYTEMLELLADFLLCRTTISFTVNVFGVFKVFSCFSIKYFKILLTNVESFQLMNAMTVSRLSMAGWLNIDVHMCKCRFNTMYTYLYLWAFGNVMTRKIVLCGMFLLWSSIIFEYS